MSLDVGSEGNSDEEAIADKSYRELNMPRGRLQITSLPIFLDNALCTLLWHSQLMSGVILLLFDGALKYFSGASTVTHFRKGRLITFRLQKLTHAPIMP